MEKKPYHHKNLKNDLIEKGIELVNKNGINQLSLRKVAQACGVSHAAPYSHFSNKEELLQEMQLHITKKFTEVLENTVSQYRGTPIFLLEFGKAYISFFISHPQYFNFLFQQGNIQIDLNIDSGRESNYQPFAIYKEQVLKLLADTNMTQSKKEDLIVALFAYVQGLTTLATMENVHYAYKWEDKLTDLIGIFSCEFINKSTHNRRERPVCGHRGRSRGPFYYRITTFGKGPWDARDPHKTTFMALKHVIRLSIWQRQKETPGVEKAPGVSSPQRKESGRSGRDNGELRFGYDPAIHSRRLRVYHRPRRLRMASRISIFFAARRFEPLNSMG